MTSRKEGGRGLVENVKKLLFLKDGYKMTLWSLKKIKNKYVQSIILSLRLLIVKTLSWIQCSFVCLDLFREFSRFVVCGWIFLQSQKN